MPDTVEETFVAALSADEAWYEIVGDRIYAPTSLGDGPNPASPQTPWCAWNEMPSTIRQEVSETSNARRRVFVLYVYDEKGDFTNINDALSAARRVLKTMAPFNTEDGSRCSQVTWAGFSGCINDPDYDLAVRFGTVYFDVSQ